MLAQLLLAFCLLALCVIVHALAMTHVMRRVRRSLRESRELLAHELAPDPRSILGGARESHRNHDLGARLRRERSPAEH